MCIRDRFRAILPDKAANEIAPDATLFSVLRQKIVELNPTADISDIMAGVEGLLDESIAVQGYTIDAPIRAAGDVEGLVDLSRIDFEALKAKFKSTARKNTEIEKLKSMIEARLKRMLELNHTRKDFLEKFQKMIDEYNAGSKNLQEFFQELIDFAQDLTEEEQRGVAEGLTEEELAIFDLLTKPEPKLSKAEEVAVKKVAKDLLEKLKVEKLVLDWRKKQQTRAEVQDTIEQILDQLPPVYIKPIYQKKCDLAYQHFYGQYPSAKKNIYSEA